MGEVTKRSKEGAAIGGVAGAAVGVAAAAKIGSAIGIASAGWAIPATVPEGCLIGEDRAGARTSFLFLLRCAAQVFEARSGRFQRRIEGSRMLETSSRLLEPAEVI